MLTYAPVGTVIRHGVIRSLTRGIGHTGRLAGDVTLDKRRLEHGGVILDSCHQSELIAVIIRHSQVSS